MTNMKNLTLYSFFTFASLWLSPVLSKYKNNNGSMYPVGNFQASLTASEGQATVAAIQSSYDGQNYVIIVSRSPATGSSSKLSCTFSGKQIIDGNDINDSNNRTKSEIISFTPLKYRGALMRSYEDSVKDTMSYRRGSTSRTIYILQETIGMCLAMTGFASDVNHLVRYVANAISEHEYLYGGEVPSVHSIVRSTLASYVRDATTHGGSRPYGIQGLMVGHDRENSKSAKLEMFTVDPSGIFRHCVGGVAAIGKDAETVRSSMSKRLEEKVNKVTTLHHSIQQNLELVMRSILENIIDYEENVSQLSLELAKQFEAVLVFENGCRSKSHSCASINYESICTSCHRSLEGIISTKKSNK